MIGILSNRLTAKCMMIKIGARIIRVSFEKLILGSPLNYLYSKSSGSAEGPGDSALEPSSF